MFWLSDGRASRQAGKGPGKSELRIWQIAKPHTMIHMCDLPDHELEDHWRVYPLGFNYSRNTPSLFSTSCYFTFTRNFVDPMFRRVLKDNYTKCHAEMELKSTSFENKTNQTNNSNKTHRMGRSFLLLCCEQHIQVNYVCLFCSFWVNRSTHLPRSKP